MYRHVKDCSFAVNNSTYKSSLKYGGGLLAALLFMFFFFPAKGQAAGREGVIYVTSESEAGVDVNGDGRLSPDTDPPVIRQHDLVKDRIKTVGVGWLDVIEGENSNVDDGKLVYISARRANRKHIMLYDIPNGTTKDTGIKAWNASISDGTVVMTRFHSPAWRHELLTYDIEAESANVVHHSSSRIEADVENGLIGFVTENQAGEDVLFYHQNGKTVQTGYGVSRQIYAPTVSDGRIGYLTMRNGNRTVGILDTKNGENQYLSVHPFDTKITLQGDKLALTLADKENAEIRAFLYNLGTGQLTDTGMNTRRIRLFGNTAVAIHGWQVRKIGDILLRHDDQEPVRLREKASPGEGFVYYGGNQ